MTVLLALNDSTRAFTPGSESQSSNRPSAFTCAFIVLGNVKLRVRGCEARRSLLVR